MMAKRMRRMTTLKDVLKEKRERRMQREHTNENHEKR